MLVEARAEVASLKKELDEARGKLESGNKPHPAPGTVASASSIRSI